MLEATLAEEGYVAWLSATLEGADIWLHLYVNDPPTNDHTSAGDMIEPEFAGYAAVKLSKWTPVTLAAGRAKSWADPAHFLRDDVGDPVLIRGCYGTHGEAGPLAFVWRRPGDGFELGGSNRLLTVQVSLAFPPAAVAYMGTGEQVTFNKTGRRKSAK